ncbi:MAG: hypothetical protein ACRDA0_10475 [Cetobacterium sp.]
MHKIKYFKFLSRRILIIKIIMFIISFTLAIGTIKTLKILEAWVNSWNI